MKLGPGRCLSSGGHEGRVKRPLRVLSALALILPACGDVPCSTGTPDSETVLFAHCDGNILETCIANEPGANEGTVVETDCEEQGLTCQLNTQGPDQCGGAAIGDSCVARDALTCDQDDQALRCVWVSEQPEPGLSGDIGVWRLEEVCGESCAQGKCG